MTERVYNVLFLCTGNSARSILAESLLRKLGEGRFHAFSAGSHPKGAVHPMTLETLAKMGYPTDGLRSKNWSEFDGENAPVMDFVFTVCDDAAGEMCPIWPGHPMTAHWGIEDPSHVDGGEIEQMKAFALALRYMKNRITAFVSLPSHHLDSAALPAALKAIGRSEGTSTAGKSRI